MKNIVAFLIVLGLIGVYDLRIIEDYRDLVKVFSVVAVMLFTLTGRRIYETQSLKSVLWLIFFIGISVLINNLVHGQEIILSVLSLKPMFGLLMFFFLIRNGFSIMDIEKLIITLGLCYTVVYLTNYLFVDNYLFGTASSERRSTITYLILGDVFGIASIIVLVNRLFERYSRIDFMLLVFVFVPLIMRGSRSHLFGVVVCLIYSFYHAVKKRGFRSLYILNILLLGIIIVPFVGVLGAMLEKTSVDLGEGAEYIRVSSLLFYLFEFNESALTVIFGNGIFNGASEYGKYIMTNVWMRGFYAEDIGLVGFWVYYGIGTSLVLLGMLIRLLSRGVAFQLRLLSLYLISVSLTTYDLYKADGILLLSFIMVMSYRYEESCLYKC